MNSVVITKNKYGITPKGVEVDKYVLKNHLGMQVEIITYGGIITSLTAPDKNNNYENVVLGFDNLNQYITNSPYFGALIGRYGNRINKGKFELNGETFQLEQNDGTNHLHGGNKGFDKVVWDAKIISVKNSKALQLTYVSKDGDGGYPGDLTTVVIYKLTNNNELEISYKATTNKTTIINLTQHSYFNLSGDFSKNILDHTLIINAKEIIPVNNILIPIGKFMSVENTSFDFIKEKVIGKDIDNNDEQLLIGNGYDHCWVLGKSKEYREVAVLHDPKTGRVLKVSTDEPGIQFYSGNFLDGTLPNPQGGTYGQRSGMCLETQHYPDSPNQPDFPSVVLNPNETYTSRTTFSFSVK